MVWRGWFAPAHTLYDGDTFFALATGQVRAHRITVSDLAAEVTVLAILNAVWATEDAEMPASTVRQGFA